MEKVYLSKITVLVKLNLHWTGKEWTMNLVLNFWRLKCEESLLWWHNGKLETHYILDDGETFLYVLILLLPLGLLFCNFSQWFIGIMLKPGGTCSENQVRVLLPACFSYENFMVWLCLLEFLCPSAQLGWILYAQLVSSHCVYLFIFIKIVINTGELQLYASTLV